jgi:hypothetical protein
MNLLALRDRIRTEAIANSLTYTEIETLFDVNELLNQTMPCLAWKYSGETNNFSEVGTEMSLNIYLLTNFPDSVKTETADYQRDYIITQQDLLRTYFYTWLQAMPFESGSDFLEVLTTDEIPIAERLSINAFLTMEFRVNISIKRDFCVDPEQIAPTPSQVQVYFNDVLRYTQACNVDLELILKNQDGNLINDATFTGYEIIVTQGGGQVTININGVLWDVIDAGDTEDIIVRQSSGSTQVGSKQGQYYRIGNSVITLEDALGTVISTTNVKAEDTETIVAPSARVSNSDDSYDVNVVSGGDLELPDIEISNSDNSFTTASPSVKDVHLSDITISNSDDSYSVTSPSAINVEVPDEAITINSAAFITKPSKKDQDILLKDVSGTTITPVSLSGNTITILDAVVGGSKGLMPLKTGQTTSYASNDDGATQRGRLTDFNTIPYLNPYGDNFRFTDELGGQTFTNNIVIDWSTWDGGSSVNGYCFNLYSSQTGTQSWDDWMLNSPYTCSTFADWYLVNFQEMASLLNMNETLGLNGYPFNIVTSPNNRMYTSTTYSVNTNQALFKQHSFSYISHVNKTTAYRAMLVRIFTISGTTLS